VSLEGHTKVAALQCYSNSFKIVFDNLDISVKTCFMRSDRFENKSLHYINLYGVHRQIYFNSLSDVHPHCCANSPDKISSLLLPSVEDYMAMRIHNTCVQNTHYPHGIFQVDI